MPKNARMSSVWPHTITPHREHHLTHAYVTHSSPARPRHIWSQNYVPSFMGSLSCESGSLWLSFGLFVYPYSPFTVCICLFPWDMHTAVHACERILADDENDRCRHVCKTDIRSCIYTCGHGIGACVRAYESTTPQWCSYAYNETCPYVCVCVCVYIHIHTCIHANVYVCMHVCMCICIHRYTNSSCIYVFVLHIYMYIYIHACEPSANRRRHNVVTPGVYVCAYICIYVHTYTHILAYIHQCMCMRVSEHIHIYRHCTDAYIHTYTHICMHTYINARLLSFSTLMCMCVYTYVYTYIHAYVHTNMPGTSHSAHKQLRYVHSGRWVYVCIHVCMYACMCLCVCVYIYIYIYI
jgi:hypothetical protein